MTLPEEPGDWSEVPQEPRGPSMLSKVRWGLVAFIAISVVLIVLVVQNTQQVNIKLFWWEADAPLVVIILVTALIAVILDELVGFILKWRRRRRESDPGP